MKIIKERMTKHSVDLLTEDRQYLGNLNNSTEDGYWRFNAGMKPMTCLELTAIAKEVSNLNMDA